MFVLFSQILYNINVQNNNQYDKITAYEQLTARIEVQLQEALNVTITSTELKFRYRSDVYRYYYVGHAFAVMINSTTTYLLTGLNEINFEYQAPFLLIKFTDEFKVTYTSRVIYYEP